MYYTQNHSTQLHSTPQNFSALQRRQTVEWDELSHFFRSYLCTGDQTWPRKLTKPTMKLLSLLLVDIFCEQRFELREVYDILIVMFEQESPDQCYQDGMVTAITRLFCCKKLYPVMQDMFRKFHGWFCAGGTDEGSLCNLFEHFTNQAAVLDIYNFTGEFNVCRECPYRDAKANHSRSTRLKRQYSVRTLLYSVSSMLKTQEVPMNPKGKSVLFRQYLIVVGDLADCLTDDMMELDWF